ncbi:hypothetical protein PENSOL_c013G04724 [Penicillium solitum]|uniref:LysM domain-containing protein n=1 Tax=Penicillium solitum TaxID=60172 RepID=A0A1V6R7H9_9EURO|nr:uncharacterized protein PENSOL_c013G04724 [Penicillium solitum]OQD97136.1 hypothetical protein PENSOL_c013G04724 [Penicillium solitum]
MAHGMILCTLLFTATWSLALAYSNNTFQIYNSDSLSNVSASDSCISALKENVTCYVDLGDAVTRTTTWSSNALDLMCADSCKKSLDDYVSNVDISCGTTSTYNISGTEQAASLAGQKMQWKQSTTCLEDPSTGDYCNLVLQRAASNGSKSLACADCNLKYLTALANSQWGQKMISPSMVQSRISKCSASASYTITPTSSSATVTTSGTSTTAPTSNARCNVTDPDTRTYRVQQNQTCVDISGMNNVSTPALQNMNALGASCGYLQVNQTLCLPSECATLRVGGNDTCSSILASLDHKISTVTFRSWNPNLNFDCSNIGPFVGKDLCVSPPGSLSIPDSFPLAPATTKAPVPTDAVTSSNTKCGHWYKIQSDDHCDDVEEKFDLSAKDFYFLNPQLNNTCEQLWVNNSYCVQPVGNLASYSGYNKKHYTTLKNTINLSATQTANRTTSHFFYSYPPMTTTTASYNATLDELRANYTLCTSALSYYNVTGSDVGDSNDPDWTSEYQRVCLLNPNSAIPTAPFNTSIPFTTAESTSGTKSSGSPSSAGKATAGATSTTPQAPQKTTT